MNELKICIKGCFVRTRFVIQNLSDCHYSRHFEQRIHTHIFYFLFRAILNQKFFCQDTFEAELFIHGNRGPAIFLFFGLVISTIISTAPAVDSLGRTFVSSTTPSLGLSPIFWSGPLKNTATTLPLWFSLVHLNIPILTLHVAL